ncbi:MAG: HD domain-containing protein [Clostridium sp.]|jgi:tRNA nucleotidyltransferase (CCA-adding enzyme)|nr:HD domain-containing protein [Clostridium sp.]
MRIRLPEKVKHILDVLTAAGHEAYIVGGCVRDSILGRRPQDWDITTSAKPPQVKALFPRTLDTGIRHGTVTVLSGRESFEVTTYRMDGAYEDGRRPVQVTFTSSLAEDLKRRDFTINAMAYHEKRGLVDDFHGLEDMEKKRIRCVGNAKERFTEDALRILRAIRFSAQLGYEIEADTRAAIEELAAGLLRISAERIREELVKLLVSDHPQYFRIVYDTGIAAFILPEWEPVMKTEQDCLRRCHTVGEHILRSLEEIPGKKDLRLAMLFHDIGKPQTRTTDSEGDTHFYGHSEVGAEMTRAILKRLKFDNRTIHMVTKLVRYHDYGDSTEQDLRSVRRALNRIGEDVFPQIFAVKKADILAQGLYQRQEKLEKLERFQEIYEGVLWRKDCVSLKSLAVSGKDLLAFGRRPGKELGETLERLLELVLDHPECNEREYLLKQALEGADRRA